MKKTKTFQCGVINQLEQECRKLDQCASNFNNFYGPILYPNTPFTATAVVGLHVGPIAYILYSPTRRLCLSSLGSFERVS